eukprot:364721-Chlamydomonas_euryale.AAC.17
MPKLVRMSSTTPLPPWPTTIERRICAVCPAARRGTCTKHVSCFSDSQEEDQQHAARLHASRATQRAAVATMPQEATQLEAVA